MISRWTALLVLLQLGAIPPVLSTPRGAIEGTVVRMGTREPLGDVRVVLINTAPVDIDPTRPPASPSATTDAQGHFSLKNLEPGGYRLTFSASGYVRQEYGQRNFPGRGMQVNLSDGQELRDLVVELTPTGAVTGTIRDADNRPLAGVPVQLMRENYDQSGERRLRPNASVVRTDDRGEFRIYSVTPGRYYLNAGTPQGPPGTGDQQPLANEAPENYSNAYFPGVTDLKFAIPIDIQSGAVKTGVDFTLSRVEGVRVAGRVIDSTTGKPPENLKVRLAYRDPGTPWDYDLEGMGRTKVTLNKDGTFEFRGVLPGLFAVSATADIPGQPAPPQGTTPLHLIGYVPLVVGGSDIDNVVVIVSPGASITGRIRVEGKDDWMSAFQTINATLGVTLSPSSNGVLPSTPGVPAPTYGALNPDGTFRIDNVMPGEYRLQVNWLRSSFYIKEARFGATDVLAHRFEFTGREQASLGIVLSPGVASADGVVTNNRLGGAAGAQVVLVPDQARHRPELFKAVTTNQNGGFTISNVPPGDYRVYAFQSIELYRWFDLDYLKNFEQFSRSVRLTEAARQTLDLRLIP